MDKTKLKEYIDARSQNIETLAEKIGVHRSTLYRKINGSCPMSVEEAKQISNVLELSVVEASNIFFN